MLNLQQLISAQRSGEQLISTMTEDERFIIQNYCLAAAGELVQIGAQEKAPMDEMVMNGIRCGIALGTQITIVRGEVKRRS